jgi:hypothetical protein
MPTLVYNSANTVYAGALTGRVLIGRRLPSGLSLADPSVSRLHAWIDPLTGNGPGWIITDAGGKSGLSVNGKPIQRHQLNDGDVIGIGAVRIRFVAEDVLPLNAKPVHFSLPSQDAAGAGILFNCSCGAPIWVVTELAGKKGICRHCKNPVTVPGSFPAAIAATTSAPAPQAVAPRRTYRCAVCHADISADENLINCPDCAMHFHADCWQENLGCSSYGCPQVNALQPQTTTDGSAQTIGAALSGNSHIAGESDASSSTPWELIAIAASVLATILGALAFGIPAALVAAWTLVLMLQHRRKSLLLIALLISMAGIVVGLAASDIWYFNGHVPTIR